MGRVAAFYDLPEQAEPSPRLTQALDALAEARDELWRDVPDLEKVRRDVIAAIRIVNVERWQHEDREPVSAS